MDQDRESSDIERELIEFAIVKKTEGLTLRLREDEKSMILEAADKAGDPAGTYVVKAVKLYSHLVDKFGWINHLINKDI